MSVKSSEKSEMNSLAFSQKALREEIAPPSFGSVKARITTAARSLGWTTTRTRDVWYADPRISINADEMRDLERVSGLAYAREEMRTNDQLIAKIDAFMEGHDADFYSAFRTAVRSFFGVSHRA